MIKLEEKAYESKCKNLMASGYDADCAYRQGYVEGAKENGVYWHDLRKNPQDLPEQSVLFWNISKRVIGVAEIAKNQYCSFEAYYNIPDKRWETLRDPYTADVIAWCDLPEFTEGFASTDY